METATSHRIDPANVEKARERIKGIVKKTPLEYNEYLSERYQCKVLLKREDLQIGRSYKIRGAANCMRSMEKNELERGIVCASAGNHAQGVAISCTQLEVKGTIFMPLTAPQVKVSKVRKYGKGFVDVRLVGDTFDDAYAAALQFKEEHDLVFIHPFNDKRIIEGQGTIAAEILEAAKEPIDYVICAHGGGGVSSGVGSYMKALSPYTKVIAAEPTGAASMTAALAAGHPVQLEHIDKFVDGASVGKVGEITFAVGREVLDKVVVVPEGMVCTMILTIYNTDAIVVEPAGALSLCGLEMVKEEIKGKTVVCVVGGSNNDIDRLPEIKERSLIYEGLLHYFVVNLPSRPGSLGEFLSKVVTDQVDVIRLEHQKKSNKEIGNSLLGITVEEHAHYNRLLKRMDDAGVRYTIIDKDPDLYYFFFNG